MKTVGIIRRIDSLGRLVIPKEFRDYLNFGKNDTIEIVASDNGVFLKKVHSSDTNSFKPQANISK